MSSIYLREWKIRNRIMNLGIHRRDISSWFSIFSTKRTLLFTRYAHITDAEPFLDAGFKNPYLVEEMFSRCRRDPSCIEEQIKKYKGYKDQYTALGLDDWMAEEWVRFFGDKGLFCCERGWKSARIASRFNLRLREVDKITQEFVTENFTKEEIFTAFELGRIWYRERIDYKKLQEFREKYGPDQHPYLTAALIRRKESLSEEKVKERVAFYQSLGFPSLSAQEWVSAELIYDRELTEEEVLTWHSAGVDKGHRALPWLVEFPLKTALEWFKTDIPIDEVKRWQAEEISPEVAGVFWRVGFDDPKEVKYIMKMYGIEKFLEVLPYVERIAGSPEDIRHWFEWDSERGYKMKDWLSLGVNNLDLVFALERGYLTPEGLKELLSYTYLERVVEEIVGNWKHYKQVLEEVAKEALKRETVKLFKRRQK